MSDIIIQIEELRKNYGNNAVLKGLNFIVNKGEIFGLLGINGAGKTTALECIEGLRNYDSGNIKIHGKIGIQLQSASLSDYIKPMEALNLFAKWNRTKVDTSLVEVFGINELKNKKYFELSTGQKRRVHLAISLINNPDIIFLDEPTAGLDVEGRIALHQHIKKLKENGKTIILTSHDMTEIETLCDRIAILNNGNITFLGSISQLNKKINKNYIINIKTQKGDESFTAENIGDTLLTLLTDYKQKGLTILDIKIDKGTLEQHFITLTKGDKI